MTVKMLKVEYSGKWLVTDYQLSSIYNFDEGIQFEGWCSAYSLPISNKESLRSFSWQLQGVREADLKPWDLTQLKCSNGNFTFSIIFTTIHWTKWSEIDSNLNIRNFYCFYTNGGWEMEVKSVGNRNTWCTFIIQHNVTWYEATQAPLL